MRILIDTNVLIDAAMRRQPWEQDADRVLAWAEQAGTAAVAWHSLPLMAYVLKSEARSHVKALLLRVPVVEVGQADALQALKLPMTDLEDAFQVAAALRHQADFIVTRDGRDFRNSPVPALSPEAFVQKVKAS